MLNWGKYYGPVSQKRNIKLICAASLFEFNHNYTAMYKVVLQDVGTSFKVYSFDDVTESL